MNRLLLFLLGALCFHVPICHAQDPVAVKIKQIGLGGVFKQNAPSSLVQTSVRNTTAQPISFSLFVAEVSLAGEFAPITDTIRIPLTLGPSEERLVDAPLPLTPDQFAVVYVEARDARGRPIGKDARRANTAVTQEQIVAMICSTPEVCSSLRKTILLSGGPEEQTQKSHALNLVQLLDPPSEDWAYMQASVVILAAPASGLSNAQLDALQLYMLRGGKLILVDDQLGDAASNPVRKGSGGDAPDTRFLAAYRSRYPEAQIRTVGSGSFGHFASITGKSLSDFLRPLGFSGSTPEEVRRQFAFGILRENNGSEIGEAGWLEKRLGTSFRFPSFLEILLWMLGYILLMALLNFLLLRRLGKQEWGWITIPAFAILVSALLYFSSERHRPRNFGVDEMAVYRMDDKSDLATAVTRIRVSAPSRSVLTAQLPGSWTFVAPNRGIFQFEFAGRTPIAFLSEIQIGTVWQATFPLRRWSIHDLHFESHRRFAGRVYRDSTGHIHNESGVAFGQAIVVDRDDVLLLGYFPTGAVLDLGHVKRLSYESASGRFDAKGVAYPGPPFGTRFTKDEERYSVVGKEAEREAEALDTSPFSLLELIRGWSRKGDDVFSDTKAVFFGLTEQAPVGAALADLSPERKSASLVVVTFGDWP